MIYFLLAVGYGHLPVKKQDTINAILCSPKKDELLEWLSQQHMYLQIDNYILTHAGVPPIWSIKQTKRYAKELEYILKNPVTRQLISF